MAKVANGGKLSSFAEQGRGGDDKPPPSFPPFPFFRACFRQKANPPFELVLTKSHKSTLAALRRWRSRWRCLCCQGGGRREPCGGNRDTRCEHRGGRTTSRQRHTRPRHPSFNPARAPRGVARVPPATSHTDRACFSVLLLRLCRKVGFSLLCRTHMSNSAPDTRPSPHDTAGV